MHGPDNINHYIITKSRARSLFSFGQPHMWICMFIKCPINTHKQLTSYKRSQIVTWCYNKFEKNPKNSEKRKISNRCMDLIKLTTYITKSLAVHCFHLAGPTCEYVRMYVQMGCTMHPISPLILFCFSLIN